MSDLLPPLSPEKYCEILDITPVCTVDILFFNENKTETLLFKRKNEPVKDVYFSVGGRLLKGESLEDCAVRQAFREAGITVQKKELVLGGIQEEIHPNSRFENVSYHAVDIFYGCVLDPSKKVTLDGQHSECRWFPVSDKTLHPFIQKKITKLLEAYG